MEHRLYADWNQIQLMIQALARDITNSPIYKDILSIYGIPRGGLIPATLLSYHMGIPIIECPQQGTLIVDDIVDSGATMSLYRGFPFACLIYKPETSKEIPTFFAYNHTHSHQWIVFPWEKKDSPEKRDRDLVV
jgi:hypoxanthine phosphoribosyltransferase